MEYVVAFLFFIVLYAAFIWRKATQQRTRLRKLIRRHLKTLALKRARGMTLDDYGTLVDSGWAKEIAYFYDTVVPERLRTGYGVSDVAALIEQEIRGVPRRTLDEWTMAGGGDIASGDDFEFHVADLLEENGWQVRHMGRSGDQGADLLAEKGEVSLAVQCKLYSQPVGNKAVQEALSAQRYYSTSHAVVISNAAFTRSAMKLAQSADVLLLHTSDVDTLDSLVDGDAQEGEAAEWARQ